MRNTPRVLFVTQENKCVADGDVVFDGFSGVQHLFHEVHILILKTGSKKTTLEVKRTARNVFVYEVSTPWAWQLTAASQNLVIQELLFNEEFRPDIVVARDPYKSAVVALFLASTYNKPAQLQVSAAVDFSYQSWWQRLLAYYTIPRFLSIRTATDSLRSTISDNYKTHDLAVLPRLHSYEKLLQLDQTVNFSQSYPDFSFFVLYVASFGSVDTAFRAIDATADVLRNNPKVALVITGPILGEDDCRRRIKILGLERQVIFIAKPTDILSYIKASNILLVTESSLDADELIYKAAAVGVPQIMASTPTRLNFFEPGVSASLCDSLVVEEFTQAIRTLLNNVSLRKIYSLRSQQAIQQHFHDSEATYREAYRQTIEDVLFLEDTSKNSV